MPHASCVIVQERLLAAGARPVSILNPIFVAWQPLGRPSGASSGWMAAAPFPIDTRILPSAEITRMYGEWRAAGCAVRGYAKQALTGSYAAYANALAATATGAIEFLAVAARLPDGTGCTLVNENYVDPSVDGMLHDAAVLGLAMAPFFPEETFGGPVTDADGAVHGELTCIGHSFRKEKESKLARFVESALAIPGVTLRATLEPERTPDESAFARVRLAAVWGSLDALKTLKVQNMSSAGLHADLAAFRDQVNQQAAQT
jgi:hypothetical protein